MIKSLILSGALLVAPITNEEIVELEPVVEEVPNETTATEEKGFDWKVWAEQWFSPQQITTISAWLTALGAVLALAIKLKALAKKDQLTQASMKQLINELLEKALGDNVKPMLDKVSEQLDKNKELNKFLVEVVALTQEDNATSRVAILELIAKLGVIDDNTLQIAKETILEEEKEEEEKKEQAKEEVKEIIEETEDKGLTI